MARTVVILENGLNRRFRAKVGEKYGGKKGSLGIAIAEAVELWLKANKR